MGEGRRASRPSESARPGAIGQQGRSVRPGMVIAGGSLAGNESSSASSRLASRRSTHAPGDACSSCINISCSCGMRPPGPNSPLTPRGSARRSSGPAVPSSGLLRTVLLRAFQSWSLFLSDLLFLLVAPFRGLAILLPREPPQVASKVLTETADSAVLARDDRRSQA